MSVRRRISSSAPRGRLCQLRGVFLLVFASIAIAGCGESLEEKVASALDREQQRRLQLEEKASYQAAGSSRPEPRQGANHDKAGSHGPSPQEGNDSPRHVGDPDLRIGHASVHVDRLEDSVPDRAINKSPGN